MKGRYILILICLYGMIYTRAQVWENPMTLEHEWSAYGIGDPYIMKHRGLFYLYCSTKDAETGVKCWSSRDLSSWTYGGLCSSDPITKGAYAPEVIYWDGMFYMYTSPAGNGHYVLSSESPTGPFIKITNNFGKRIDGSVFIDDDAGMYFYHANNGGIEGCEMPEPYIFGESVDLNADINNGWTEGPCVFKRNGTYYMIYTGNHLISKGYRIDYAKNSTGPIAAFEAAEKQNPILLNTMGEHVGLGHGTVFIGPDLDSYFLTYHNLVSKNGPQRQINFDRIAWNGDKMILLGSTTFEQDTIILPNYYDYFDRSETGSQWTFPSGGSWSIKDNAYLSQDTILASGNNNFIAVMAIEGTENYTAEFNVREITRENTGSALGLVFDYLDLNNYGLALINSASDQLELKYVQNGEWSTAIFIDLPGEQDYSKWHSARIEKFDGTYKFFLDHMLLYTGDFSLEPGSIGYSTAHCEADFSFIAYSNKVNGSGIFDIYKPLPGSIDAVLYNTGGEGKAFHEATPEMRSEVFIRTDENEIAAASPGGYALATFEPGDWYTYSINTESAGLYNLEFIYKTASDEAQLRIFVDETLVADHIDLPASGAETWNSVLIKNLDLPGGFHKLRIEAVSGNSDLYTMNFMKADNAAFDLRYDFNFSFGMGWEYRDGDWSITNNTAEIDGYGKRTCGSNLWTDYTIFTDIKFSRSMNAGLIFRVNNPSQGGAGDDPVAGTDFFQGYFAGFNFSRVVLGKHNYNWEQLASASGSFKLDTWYRMKVRVIGNRIRIYVDDMDTPLIDFTDPNPLVNGMAGVRSFNTHVQYDNLRVSSDTTLTSIEGSGSRAMDKIEIYPNPATDHIRVSLEESTDMELRLLNIEGKEIMRVAVDDSKDIIPLSSITPGLYIVQLRSAARTVFRKLIIE